MFHVLRIFLLILSYCFHHGFCHSSNYSEITIWPFVASERPINTNDNSKLLLFVKFLIVYNSGSENDSFALVIHSNSSSISSIDHLSQLESVLLKKVR